VFQKGSRLSFPFLFINKLILIKNSTRIMGMDIDFIVANQAIDKLRNKLSSIDQGKREKIADEIILAVNKICKEN
jgi:hypothetical protein